MKQADVIIIRFLLVLCFLFGTSPGTEYIQMKAATKPAGNHSGFRSRPIVRGATSDPTSTIARLEAWLDGGD